MQKKSNSENKYIYYASLSTSELENILQTDFQTDSNGYLSEEDIQIILNVLVQRENDSTCNTAFDIEKGWDSIKTEYSRIEANGSSLYYPPKEDSLRQHLKQKPFYRKNIAAVFICLIMVVSFSQTTIAQNLLSSVASWSKETFWFEPVVPSTDAANTNIDLQSTFSDTSIPSNLLPEWIPENYKKISEDTIETSYLKMYDSIYEDPTNNLSMSITVTYLYKDVSLAYEKDASNVDLYQKNGVDYYIMGNLNSNTAIWRNGSFECQIDGTVTRKELKKMIDSIPASN